MKRAKRLMTMVLVMVVTIAAITPFQAKISKAADVDVQILPLDGMWSPDYYLTETDQEQYYQITIPSDGKLNLRVMSYIESSWLSNPLMWEVYNSDLSKKIAGDSVSGTESSPGTQSVAYVLSAGTYYCKIYSNKTGKYKLYAQFASYSTNDQEAISYDSPLVYQLGNTITGALTETDREDWFKIVIPSNGYYTQKVVSYIEYSYGSNPLEWELYNSDLSKKIAKSTVSGSETSPTTQKQDMDLSQGMIYYVKIYSSAKTGKYTFQMTKLTPDTCTHDYEKTWYDATYFAKGYCSYQCKKCGHSYKGDYQPVKKLGQSYVNQYGCSVGKGKIKLSWGTVSDASGYQIRYSKKGNMKNGKTISVKGQSKSKKTIKKLSRRKKYFIQVRAYKKSKGKTVYGKWSQKKSFRTK